jgi:regulator of cell morphogenesis and NO signaling
MNMQENQMIGELVAQDYRTASVFKKYGIDFCCQGGRTIHDACEKKNIDTKSVLSDLDAVLFAANDKGSDYQSWPLDTLADYIEKKHHRYVEEKIQEIKPYLEKLCKVHGYRHPELFKITAHFNTTAGELAMHMKKEELILFPFIRKMAQAKLTNAVLETPKFTTVKNPILMMTVEHTAEGDRLREIEGLSNHYTPPADACNTYRVTYALLKEFEQDLHLHIHLENNILFPKAIQLEKLLLN